MLSPSLNSSEKHTSKFCLSNTHFSIFPCCPSTFCCDSLSLDMLIPSIRLHQVPLFLLSIWKRQTSFKMSSAKNWTNLLCDFIKPTLSSAGGTNIIPRTLPTHPCHLLITFSSLTLNLDVIPHHISWPLYSSHSSVFHFCKCYNFPLISLTIFPITGFGGAKNCWFCALILNYSVEPMVVKSLGPRIRQAWTQIQALLLLA